MPEPRENDPSARSLEIVTSRDFLKWMDRERLSLVFTTYQTNRLFFIGLKPDGKLSGFERIFDRPMGMYAAEDSLYMSSRYQLWQFENALAPSETYNDYDRLYIPRIGHTTGDLDIHDLALDADGRVVFINCLFSCLATLSERHSFKTLWQPPFISRLAPEDRCHLNGLAMRDGRPRYVTAVSRSDVSAGWRKRRDSGGVLMDIESDQVILEGLSMPHSPRWYKDRLWVLNSGTGDLGWADPDRGVFEPLAFCPGYLRGLTFHKNHAIVGLSKPRDRAFSGLDLDRRMAEKEAEARCGFMVIELNTGDVVHWLEMEGLITELYDVQVLPGARRPMALGQRTDEICRLITMEPEEDGREPERNIFIAPLETEHPRAAAPGAKAPAGAPSPAPGPLSSPEAPSYASAAGAGSAPAGGGFQFQVLDRIAPDDVRRFEGYTFPSVGKRWRVKPPEGPLAAVVAASGNRPAGGILAEIRPDGAAAEVISFFLAPDKRNQGAGKRLLADMGAHLAGKGCRAVHLTFRSDWKSRQALAHILQKDGWTRPRVVHIIGKGKVDAIGASPLLKRFRLPDEYEVFPWADLTGEERSDILRRQEAENWFPPPLNPFQEEAKMEPLNSIGLRKDGRVAGWMITHRTTRDTIQYTCLFVDPQIEGMGRGIALVAEAIRRHIDSGVPFGIFMADIRNERMVRFARRRLKPLLINLVESYYSQKVLGKTH